MLLKNETSLYTSNVAMSDWSGYINNIGADMFANAKVGDKIRVYISDPAGDYQQGSFKNGSTWQGLNSELDVVGLTDADFSKGYYEMTLDENTLAQVKADGLIVSGCNYTANKVVLIKNSYKEGSADAVLYDDGDVDMSDWTGFINTMGADLFANALVVRGCNYTATRVTLMGANGSPCFARYIIDVTNDNINELKANNMEYYGATCALVNAFVLGSSYTEHYGGGTADTRYEGQGNTDIYNAAKLNVDGVDVLYTGPKKLIAGS